MFYERSLEEFMSCKDGWGTWFVNGNVSEARRGHVRSRLVAVENREKPDPANYQDSSGVEVVGRIAGLAARGGVRVWEGVVSRGRSEGGRGGGRARSADSVAGGGGGAGTCWGWGVGVGEGEMDGCSRVRCLHTLAQPHRPAQGVFTRLGCRAARRRRFCCQAQLGPFSFGSAMDDEVLQRIYQVHVQKILPPFTHAWQPAAGSLVLALSRVAALAVGTRARPPLADRA